MWRRSVKAAILAVSLVVSAVAVASAFPVVVTDISFEGLEEIREREVRDAIRIEVGDEVRESDLKAASEDIYELGWFREVMVRPEPLADGEVVFQVTEYPVIEEIEITGNVNRRTYGLFGIDLFSLPIVSTTKIKQLLLQEDIRRRRVFNRVKLETALREIITEYNERGYVLIAVGDVTIAEKLSIEFVEGRVGGNIIDGLRTVPMAVAEEMIDLPLGEPLMQPDLQRVLMALRNSVYFTDVEVVPDPGATDDEVVLHWTLAERSLTDEALEIDDVVMDGVERFSSQVVADSLREMPASPVGNYELLRVIEPLFDLYQEAGYVMVRFSIVGTEDRTLRLLAEEGVVSQVLISGNTRTLDHVIIQNLKIEAGDILTRRALQTGYQRLNSFGYFRSIDVIPEWSDEGVRLSVIVTERRDLGGMNGTLAVEPNTGGIVGELTVDQKNLFGTGQDVEISYSRGFSGDVEPMTSTWMLGYSTIASYSGFDRVGVDLYRTVRESGDDEYLTVGGKIAFDYPIADYSDLALSYKHEEERLVGTQDWTPIDSITVGIVYDDLDDPYFPTEGNRQSISVEKAGGFAPGLDYTKVGFLWIDFSPVRNVLFGQLDQTFGIRFRGGWADAGLSSSQAFGLGGPTAVRGTEVDSVRRMFIANFEHRVELVEGLVFTTFLDAGLDLDSIRLDDVKASTGFGFGINAAGIYVRLEFIWVIEEGMTWFPTFDIGFGPMF